MPSTYDNNREKIEQCVPEAWWALEAWEQGSRSLNLPFYIVEASRSQGRQNTLARQGRFTWEDCESDVKSGRMTMDMARRIWKLVQEFGGIPGNKVTWTLDSMHIQRLAVDIMPTMVQPTRKFFSDVAAVAAQWGIYRPKALVLAGDIGHFQLDKVPPRPVATPLSRRIDQLQKALQRTKNPVRRNAIERRIRRLQELPPT